jgi:hypothetical protein
MGAYSQDFGGPLTSEQIKAVVTYIRTWEPNAPDNPDWRSMMDASAAPADDVGNTASADAGGNDAEGGGDDSDS